MKSAWLMCPAISSGALIIPAALPKSAAVPPLPSPLPSILVRPPQVVLPAIRRDDRHVAVAAACRARVLGNRDLDALEHVFAPRFCGMQRVERIARLREVGGMAPVVDGP